MQKSTKPIPDGYHTITPSLTLTDAAGALEFYANAFGAKELSRIAGPGGKIMHAEMQIGTSRVMLQDELPEMRNKSPKGYGGSPVSFYVYLDDVDASFKRAKVAGAKSVMELEDMFWGDRTCCVEDPYGHTWTLAQHTNDPSPDEMKKGQEAFTAKMQQHATR